MPSPSTGPKAAVEKAKRRIELRLLGARFVEFAPVEAGRLDSESGDEVFYYGAYYAHRIGNQFLASNGRRFIMSNGFLGSHAYNLALLFLVFREDRAALERALRSNLKKFFAECCLGAANCLIGRALLIETLSYEQEDMRHVFAQAAASAELDAKAKKLSHFMEQLLNLHEMAHYFEHRAGPAWWNEIRALDEGRMGARIDRWRQTYPADLSVETVCDAVAVAMSLAGAGGADAELDLVSRARMAAFGFLCFRELVSLQKSAEATARTARDEDQRIDVGSEKRPRFQFSYQIGRDAAMDQRVQEILPMIEEEAAQRRFELYGEDGYFPLPQDAARRLRAAFEAFMETDENSDTPPGVATNANQRGIAQLLAESLHGYDKGAEHLLWRSKQFSVGGDAIDP